METLQRFQFRRLAAALAVLCGTAGSVHAQGEPAPGADAESHATVARYTVLVDLDENVLHFMSGDVILWSAPVGTGTGMRVITEDDEWDFSTPAGRFEVQYKEWDPVWIAPDWFYVENNLPLPPKTSPVRHMRGILGEAAVYIAPHLAIHGTDTPELLGQRVSHGCIRLENRYAKRLYHNVQVGTEVVIVGGDHHRDNGRVVDLRLGYDPSLASTGSRGTSRPDPVREGWKRMATPALLDALDAHVAAGSDSRWDEVAVLLLQRSRMHDDAALQGLLARAGALPTAGMEREWATLLVDAYRASAQRVMATVARLEPGEARDAAGLIVAASMALFSGDLGDAGAPWPTHRIARQLLSGPAVRGWDLLAEAEREYRDR
jgi:hypothetical protein